MPTAISDPAELQELTGLLEEHGLYVPDDITTVEQLIRYLLVGLKTKAATEALQEAKRAREQARRGKNPDSPRDESDDDDVDAMNQALAVGQFSTASDGGGRRYRDPAARAKALVDQQERFHKNPNFARRAY